MELRHLRYFVAVAEELHFRRAAERLHVAQPAISEQVRKLEQELGVQLFERTHRRVTLTAAGSALLDEARPLLRHVDVARQAAQTADERAVMRVRLGYLSDSMPASVPRALRQLASATPRVEVDFRTGPAMRLIEDLRADRLDAVLAALPAPTRGLRTTVLGEQRAFAVLPAGHPHAIATSTSLDRLAPERIVVLPREANPTFHTAVAAMCRTAGLAPTLVETPEARVEQVLLAVAAGSGLAVVPEAVTERQPPAGIRFVPLDSDGPAFVNALLTSPHTQSIATMTLARALSRAAERRLTEVPRQVATPAALAA